MPHLKRALSLLYWAPAAVLLTEFCTVKRVSGRSMQVRILVMLRLVSSSPLAVSQLSTQILHFYGGMWEYLTGIASIRAIEEVILSFSSIWYFLVKETGFNRRRSPENPRYELIKRIIAIEGDTVTFSTIFRASY
jgi:hypothetical protein